MGGNGASLGVSKAGKPYGTEYHTVYQQGNIKFLEINNGVNPTPPLETMTQGRVYATIGTNGSPTWITYYDKTNKRYKTIDLGHYHKVNGVAIKPHTALGYYHEGTVQALTTKEQKMVERVMNTWRNRK